MDSFLKSFGLFALFLAITYGYKKIQDYYTSKRSGLHENEKVYTAADAFARGASLRDVGDILEDCFEFDEGDAGKILSGAIPRRTDRDGGYRAFIRSVNKAVGEKLYDENRRPPTASEGPPSPGAEANATPLSGKNRRLSK